MLINPWHLSPLCYLSSKVKGISQDEPMYQHPLEENRQWIFKKSPAGLEKGGKKRHFYSISYTAFQWWFYSGPEGGECWIIVQKEQWQHSSSGEQWKSRMGFPLPCNQGGTGLLANAPNHKWIWREHFPFHFSACKCTFHSSSRCFNKCGGMGEPCRANPSQGQEERGSTRQDLGFRDLQSSENPCPARGFTLHLHGLNILCSTCWVLTLEILGEVFQRSIFKAGQVLKQPLRWLKRARKKPPPSPLPFEFSYWLAQHVSLW